MTRARPFRSLALATLVLAVVAGGMRSRAGEAAQACRAAVDATSSAVDGDVLYGAAAVGRRDVWAVGIHYEGGLGSPLASRWDGRTWTSTEVAVPGTSTDGQVTLQDVDALRADDVWAVGTLRNHATVVTRWDGTRWSAVASPDGGVVENELLGVDAATAGDAWAVGKYLLGGNYRTLAEHWDGKRWSIVESPNPGRSNVLKDVVVTAADETWAVGWFVNDAGRYRTLVERWDGARWREVPSPNVGADDNLLTGVASTAAGDLWAVGWTADGPERSRALLLRWDGERWAVAKVPPIDSPQVQLTAVVVAPGGVLAVGQAVENEVFRPLILRSYGTRWAEVPVAGAGPGDAFLSGAAAPARDNLVAVGTGLFDLGYGSLVVRGCDGAG